VSCDFVDYVIIPINPYPLPYMGFAWAEQLNLLGKDPHGGEA